MAPEQLFLSSVCSRILQGLKNFYLQLALAFMLMSAQENSLIILGEFSTD